MGRAGSEAAGIMQAARAMRAGHEYLQDQSSHEGNGGPVR